MSLLLKNRDHGWAAYVWLIFFSFFFLQPILDKHTTGRDWLITILATIVFLVLYFTMFRVCKPWNYMILVCMAAMGLGLARINVGSSVFIIYTAIFLPWVIRNSKAAFAALGVLIVLVAGDAYFFHADVGFWTTSMIVTLGAGLSNTYFAEKNRADQKLRMAHEEIEHLAKVAERERIARDLHDVLGHTLTLIAVKSTLAGKLLDKDPQKVQKVRAAIADIEKVSREAMAEIRNTLGGYRSYKVGEELQRARSVLQSAGVSVEAETGNVPLTVAQESVVALIMREAVTNVVRHAYARNCRLRVARNNGNCVLEVQDDGHGGLNALGNGVRGMRERIEALGGTFAYETSAGTSLKFEFPLTSK
jgi:two-component system, NarL family, sensor histidine kinase DesK